jgi:hypothetical protein
LNTITASWKTAVSSARIRSEVGVGWSIVAFLISFNQTISANRGNLKVGDWTVVASLEATSVISQNLSELSQLA